MSDQQAAELYDLLIKAKHKIGPQKVEYPFQLGWNAAIDFSIQKLRFVCDEHDGETLE
jgi:hypothetical protein